MGNVVYLPGAAPYRGERTLGVNPANAFRLQPMPGKQRHAIIPKNAITNLDSAGNDRMSNH